MELVLLCVSLILMQIPTIASLDSLADPVVDGEAIDGLGTDYPERQITQPMEDEPSWMAGPNPPGLPEAIQAKIQSRLFALKEQFEALNETEKADIRAKAMEMRDKIALMPPPPPICPPPKECDCDVDDDDDDEDEHFTPPHPWWMRPRPPHGMFGQNVQQFQNYQIPYNQNVQGQHFQRFQPGQFENRFIRPMHGPINQASNSAIYPSAQNAEKTYVDSTDVASEHKAYPHRSRRELARLKQTFGLTNPNEWWQDIDSGRGNAVSDRIASWDLGAATQHSISSGLDHYAPARHIGTINRGTVHNPAMGGPADRIFGYNPDFNREDWHAFKYKPRGQFQQYQNKPSDFFKKMKYLPAGAEFFYNPNPELRPALTGVSVNPADANVYSDKFLSQNPGQNLPRGIYKLEWLQLVPTADKTKVEGFNIVLKNSQTGQHFRLDNADVNQFQGASPFRQQFNTVAQHWGGSGLAEGPAGSVYDRNIQGFRIDSGQRDNYYGTPYYYNRWSSHLPSKF